MGLMDKFKNLFTEEVEEEVKPIKKEVRQVEIPSPKRETRSVEIEKPTVSDNETVNKDEKFVFPLYFDDKDFDDLEKPKKVEKPAPKATKPEAYQGTKVQTKIEKRFEASPIISPVYGVLDKNYKKEDIATRTETPTNYYRKPKHVTVDDIRNKAFGTLEDDLESTLFGDTSILFKDEIDHIDNIDEDNTLDIFEELNFDEETPEYITEDETDMMNDLEISDSTLEENDLTTFSDDELPEDEQMSVIEVPDSTFEEDMDADTILLAKQLEEQKKKLEEINDYISEEEPKQKKRSKKENKDNKDNLTESELLGLVDAMYEKREEE